MKQDELFKMLDAMDSVSYNDEYEYQIFDTPNMVGDFTRMIYNHNGVTVLWCSQYKYFEIFGVDINTIPQFKLDHLGGLCYKWGTR